MKRLIKSLILTVATLFALTAVASATPSNGWKVNISSPANTTSKSFKVQYTTLSIGAEDAITVELFQNGASKGSQTTTKAYGDSGDFDVTVPSTGTYEYFIKATNTGDPAPKTTSTVSVSVTEQPQPTVNTVNVGSTDNSGASTASTATGGADAGVDGGTTAGGQDGEVNAAETGQVGDQPATTGEGDVLGETAEADKSSGNSLGWILVALAGLVVAGYAAYTYWWLPRNQSK